MINNGKPKNVLPKPETLKPYTSYAFTINPEIQHKEDSDRLRKVIRLLQRILNSAYISYKLYIEVSSQGRIHGHGYIRICDTREFYLTFVPYITARATVVIEDISDDEGWEIYITKQCAFMQCKPLYKDYGLITQEIRNKGNLDEYFEEAT